MGNSRLSESFKGLLVITSKIKKATVKIIAQAKPIK
jgi:hypothetical protein